MSRAFSRSLSGRLTLSCYAGLLLVFVPLTGWSSSPPVLMFSRDTFPDNTSPIHSRAHQVAADPVWIDLQENEDYEPRHECSFVQAGEAFLLMGGREKSDTMDIYDYQTDTWREGAPAPAEFNHFQALTYQGLVWVIGAFRDNKFPKEAPAEYVYIYDPVQDMWVQGPEIPAARRRGSAGLVMHQDKFYVIGGNTIGHDGGFVSWLDEYDPLSGQWTALSDAPNQRDHFHAALYDGKIYAIGGRLTGGPDVFLAPLVAEVDVYDLDAGVWSSLNDSLPTPRAAPAVAVFQDEILVMGGETQRGINLDRAYDIVEALDPTSGAWSDKAPMNHRRHGTQAIVSGQGIYIAAGSPSRGGGRQRNMEVYHADSPAGTPITAGSFGAPDSLVFIAGEEDLLNLSLSNTNGNQGILVLDISLTGPNADEFSLPGWNGVPILIKAGSSVSVPVAFTGNQAGREAELAVTYHTGETARTITLASAALPPPFDAAITEFRLLDAVADQDIGPLTDGASYNLTELPALLDVLVTTDEPVGSVVFDLSGPINANRVEGGAPYVLFGNSGNDYAGSAFPAGTYQLIATPYAEAGGTGQRGIADTVNFEILDDQVLNKPPVVNAGPDLEIRLPLNNNQLQGFASDDGLPNASLSWLWTVVDGPEGGLLVLSSNTSLTPVITFALEGTYSVELSATDGQLTSRDTVIVTILPELTGPLALESISLVDAQTRNNMGPVDAGSGLFPTTFPVQYILEATVPAPNRVQSVRFDLRGPWSDTFVDNAPPYRFTSAGRYGRSLKWPAGTYTLEAIPFAATRADGERGEAQVVSFTIVGGAFDREPGNAGDRFPAETPRFSLWPNPALDQVTLSTEQPIAEPWQVEIYDAYGRKVYERELPAGSRMRDIELTHLTAGYYLVRVRNRNQVSTRKILKE